MSGSLKTLSDSFTFIGFEIFFILLSMPLFYFISVHILFMLYIYIVQISFISFMLCICIDPKALGLTHLPGHPEPAHNVRRVFRNAWPLTHSPMLSGYVL